MNTPPARPEAIARLEALARRGTRRGPDDVLGAALTEAAVHLDAAARKDLVMSEVPDPGADHVVDPVTNSGEPGDAGPIVADMQPPRRVSRGRRSVAGFGVAALLGFGGFAALSAQGDGGGADSPEAAVRQLADAITNEDPLAAVDVLAPGEVRTLRRSLDGAADKAEQLELVEDASEPLAGFDLEVQDLDLEVEALADGFAKVSVVDGAIDGAMDPDGLAARIRDRMGDDTAPEAERVELTELETPDGEAPFVIAIEESDGWYVSPAYTAMEYLRINEDGPAADLGSADATQLGADSPEAAIRDAVEAARTGDWARLTELVPPSEIPAYEYRALFDQLAADYDVAPDFAVDRLDLSSEVDGDQATVSIVGAGTFGERGSTWQIGGDCTEFDAARQAANESDDYDYDYDYDSWCVSGGFSPYSIVWFYPMAGDGDGDPQVATVREGGRWFVSPVATAIDSVDDFVELFDEDMLAQFTDDYSRVEPDGAITLGEPLAISSDEASYDGSLFPRPSGVYTFAGKAGTEVIGLVEANGGEEFHTFGWAEIYGPDGQPLGDVTYGNPVELPVDGEYRVVLTAGGPSSGTFTLWDVADAPEKALDPYGESDFGSGENCFVDDLGTETCTESVLPEDCIFGSDGIVDCTSSATTFVEGVETTVPLDG